MRMRVVKIQDAGVREVANAYLSLPLHKARKKCGGDQRRCAPSSTLLHKSDNDLEVFTGSSSNHIQASVPWFFSQDQSQETTAIDLALKTQRGRKGKREGGCLC